MCASAYMRVYMSVWGCRGDGVCASVFACGSFRVRSTNFLLNLRDPPPISMQFGTLADNALKKSVQIFSDVGHAVSEIWPSKNGKRFFATRPVSQMSITFFLLEVGRSMIALFKALIWLYNSYLTNYKKSQKPKSFIFLTSNKKKFPSSKKINNGIIYPSTFASSFNQISRLRSPILDFIKII